ncbi:MAG: TldD/PmbA family protein [Euryarchaeota archaeon]|nr:TldD/PmbA family protein [Euryarchaeota archaeon]
MRREEGILMLDEDVAEATLRAIGSKATVLLAEVRLEERNMRGLAVKSSQVSSLNSLEDSGMNVRVVLPTGIGFASSNRVSRVEGARLAMQALRLAKSGKRKSPVTLSSEQPVRTNWAVSQKRSLIDITTEDKLAFLRELDSHVVKTGVKVQGRYYELIDYEIGGFFANSEGSRIRSFIPRVVIGADNMVSSKGELAMSLREWGACGGWEKVEEWDLGRVLPAEVRMLKNQLDHGRMLKPGVYDLVCGSEVTGIAAHESCGHPMEADRILGREMSQAGKSFVSQEMIGKRIGSKYATVIDDPTVPGSYGYYLYDQEGVKARPRHLYKEGLINEFLQNRETASRMNLKSNGSSRSEYYLREPIARMANTFVAPGDFEEDELIGSVKDGVLMRSFTEWNIDDKRYNQKYVSREAYFVKDGELAGPAKKCTLEITTPGFWGAIDAVSKKVELDAAECGKGDPMQGMAVCTGGPMLRLRSVTLK